MHTDRGTCVAVGITDATFELIRTFYVMFEDGTDDVTPIITHAMALIAEEGRTIDLTGQIQLEPAPVDLLTDITATLRGERRVRTQVILTRLAELNPTVYEGWAFSDLATTLADHGISVRKSDGVKVVRAEDIITALTRRDSPPRRLAGTGTTREDREESLPHPCLHLPALIRENNDQGPQGPGGQVTPGHPRVHGTPGHAPGSLPDTDGDGGHDD